MRTVMEGSAQISERRLFGGKLIVELIAGCGRGKSEGRAGADGMGREMKLRGVGIGVKIGREMLRGGELNAGVSMLGMTRLLARDNVRGRMFAPDV